MVEFRTTLNSNKTQALNKNAFKKLWWMYLLLSLIFVVIGVIGILFREDNSDLAFGITLTVFGVIFTPLVLLITKLIQRNFDKSMSLISDNTEEVYTFDENEITISQKRGEDYEAFTRAKYNYLFKVTETPTHYFLYISKAQCHVVDKTSLTQGTLIELNAHFINNLGQKFKPLKNK